MTAALSLNALYCTVYTLFGTIQTLGAAAALKVSQVVEAVVEAITGFLTGFGSSINTFFDSIFTVASETSTEISTLGVFLLCMLGIGFGVWLVNKLLSIARG